MAANAAGLGKIVVFSALGQPLRAEIEVTATREELSGMRAQLASREAFKQAGLDYASTLSGIAFALDKRPDGQLVIKLTSKTPVNDPFVDMLMELNWPTGRLVREYTFLLDPPEVAAKNAQPVVAPATAAVRSGALAPTAPRPSSIGDDTRVRAQTQTREEKQATVAEAAAPAMPKAAEKPVEKVSSDGDFHEVKRGDTLSKIAGATKPEGVTLDQMLVGLYRANPDAFIDSNVNRLRAGSVLTVPAADEVRDLTAGDAKRLLTAQSLDFGAYRARLAQAAPQSEAPEASRAAQGKVQTAVDDRKQSAAASPDKLKLSDPAVKASAPDAGAVKDSATRVAELNERGYENAGLYDPPGVGGTHVMYVLHHADKPGLYAGLPEAPQISPVVEGWKGPAKTVGLVAMGLAAAGAALHGLIARGNEVTAHDEAEAEALVDKEDKA